MSAPSPQERAAGAAVPGSSPPPYRAALYTGKSGWRGVSAAAVQNRRRDGMLKVTVPSSEQACRERSGALQPLVETRGRSDGKSARPEPKSPLPVAVRIWSATYTSRSPHPLIAGWGVVASARGQAGGRVTRPCRRLGQCRRADCLADPTPESRRQLPNAM